MFDQDTQRIYAPYPIITGLLVVLAGCIAGLLSYLLGTFLAAFIITPALCQSASATACASGDATALHIASIIASIAGVALLIRANVYRPLLVVIATLIATWPLYTIAASLPWYASMLSILFATVCSYGIFSWLLRLYNFLLAGIVISLITIAALLVTIS